MKKLMIFLIAFTLFYATQALAEGEKVITLKDGTSVNGRIVGLEQGKYIIESGALGQIRVNENNVTSIISASMPAAANTGNSPSQGTQNPQRTTNSINANQLQSEIMSNPDLMKEIAALADDPEILNLLNDPALLQAAQNKDAGAMEKNPRTYELMNNPKMRALINKIQGMQK